MLIGIEMLKYSEPLSNGKFKLSDDAPKEIKDKAKQINKDYAFIDGEKVFINVD